MIVKRLTRQNGFTVLELVLVILIIGILAATMTPARLEAPLRLDFEARRVLGDIRYTQALSMASGQRYRWVRTTSTTYQIVNQAGTAITLPNGSTTLTLSTGVSFGSFSNLPSNLVAFNSEGQPYTTSTTPGTALAATAGIPVTNGSQTRTISVTPTTGYGAIS